MVAKYRSTALQTAPTGAVCSAVDQYLAVFKHNYKKKISFDASGLERVHCITHGDAEGSRIYYTLTMFYIPDLLYFELALHKINIKLNRNKLIENSYSRKVYNNDR